MSTRGGYDIVPVVKTPSVDRGDTAKIDVYCTSSGIPPGNTLTFGYDAALSKPGDRSVWIQRNGSDGPASGSGGACHPIPDGGSADALPLDVPEQTIQETSLPPVRFFTHPAGESPDVPIPSDRSTTPHRIRPPAEIEIQTGADCEPGEYEIPFVFSYTDEDGPQQLTRETSVRVNSFPETHRWTLVCVFLFVLFVGTIATMI